MGGVVTGFAIIAAVILVGYLIGRFDLIGPQGPHVLSRLAFFVLNPCLLVTVLADADVHSLFSSVFLVTSISAAVVFTTYLLLAKLVLRRATPEALLGGAAAGYENAGNIGLAIGLYVLGDAAYSVPVIMFQLVIFAPLLLTALDVTTGPGPRMPVHRLLLRPFLNPLVIASAAGVLLAVTQAPVPEAVLEPFRIIGGAAVPVVLLGFGISLRGQRPLQPGTGRTDVLLASVLKLAVMPAIAYLLGRFAFGLTGADLFAVVLLTGLPSAQNVFVYAQRYERGVVVVRDTVLLTTIGSVPVLVLVAALLT
jgi:predicted permease